MSFLDSKMQVKKLFFLLKLQFIFRNIDKLNKLIFQKYFYIFIYI